MIANKKKMTKYLHTQRETERIIYIPFTFPPQYAFLVPLLPILFRQSVNTVYKMISVTVYRNFYMITNYQI